MMATVGLLLKALDCVLARGISAHGLQIGVDLSNDQNRQSGPSAGWCPGSPASTSPSPGCAS